MGLCGGIPFLLHVNSPFSKKCSGAKTREEGKIIHRTVFLFSTTMQVCILELTSISDFNIFVIFCPVALNRICIILVYLKHNLRTIRGTIVIVIILFVSIL